MGNNCTGRGILDCDADTEKVAEGLLQHHVLDILSDCGRASGRESQEGERCVDARPPADQLE